MCGWVFCCVWLDVLFCVVSGVCGAYMERMVVEGEGGV